MTEATTKPESQWLATGEILRRNVRQYTMVIALAVIWLLFAVLTGGEFATPRNLSNLFLQTATVGMIAIGMTLVIVTGNIDLSLGSVAALCGAVAAWMQVNAGFGSGAAMLAAIGVGLGIGLWNGFWIARFSIPAFIVTLAGMMIFRGAVLGVTNGQTIAPLTGAFRALGEQYIPPSATAALAVVLALLWLFLNARQRRARRKYGFAVLSPGMEFLKIIAFFAALAGFFGLLCFNQGLPWALVFVLVVAVIFNFFSQHTVFGRHLYALGGNADAAMLSGVNRTRCFMVLYAVFGVLTALGGLIMTARLGAATVSAGQGMELDVIAATVIGGTSLLGGEGRVYGSLVGALIMASLDNGLSLMNVDITYQYVIKGLILLIAVWGDIATRKRTLGR